MITKLYTVYRQELLKYCFTICGNASDAEDLLQETFAKALSHLDLLEELGEKPSGDLAENLQRFFVLQWK